MSAPSSAQPLPRRVMSRPTICIYFLNVNFLSFIWTLGSGACEVQGDPSGAVEHPHPPSRALDRDEQGGDQPYAYISKTLILCFFRLWAWAPWRSRGTPRGRSPRARSLLHPAAALQRYEQAADQHGPAVPPAEQPDIRLFNTGKHKHRYSNNTKLYLKCIVHQIFKNHGDFFFNLPGILCMKVLFEA